MSTTDAVVLASLLGRIGIHVHAPMTLQPDDLALTALAHRLRAFCEPVWRWHHCDSLPTKPTVSFGMCQYTSFLAMRVLNRHRIGNTQRWCCYSGHYVESKRKHSYHWWVASARHRIIVDLTADQFGGEPIVIAPMSDHRYRVRRRCSECLISNRDKWPKDAECVATDEWPNDYLPLWTANDGKVLSQDEINAWMYAHDTREDE